MMFVNEQSLRRRRVKVEARRSLGRVRVFVLRKWSAKAIALIIGPRNLTLVGIHYEKFTELIIIIGMRFALPSPPPLLPHSEHSVRLADGGAVVIVLVVLRSFTLFHWFASWFVPALLRPKSRSVSLSLHQEKWTSIYETNFRFPTVAVAAVTASRKLKAKNLHISNSMQSQWRAFGIMHMLSHPERNFSRITSCWTTRHSFITILY